ncbi:MAG: triosephosphate isomerase [Gammaproteobacteria bacterium]|jgi:triosephosphate isomerase|nr:triosephosphate isomerase [Gammaproteobacteria bacterium]
MRKKLIMGNWKMNGSYALEKGLIPEIIRKAQGLKAELVICPPFPYLASVKAVLEATAIHMGAQDLSSHDNGAYTGEVSASMLADIGCTYVIIGHSERRQYHSETDELIAKKFVQARKAGLIPVLCVGETKQQRENGETEQVVARQLSAVLSECSEQDLLQSVIAYEPVWAIGTGLAASPEQVQSVHAFLRAELAKCSENIAKKLRILYGGSVKSANANELLNLPDVDGALVGGASLLADEFVKIAAAPSSV